jgi:hypothetical protein
MSKKTIPFLDLFVKYCEASYEQERAIQIFNYFLEKSGIVVAAIKFNELLNEDCFVEVRGVLQEIEVDVLKNKVSIYYVDHPYDINVLKVVPFESFLKNTYDFYSEKGHPSHGKLRSTRLEFDIKIIEVLSAKSSRNEQDIFNFRNISTPHSRKMNQIFKSFRDSYGEGYRSISQKGFLDYINQKIAKEVSDHDLKFLWKSFYSGDIDAPPEKDGL